MKKRIMCVLAAAAFCLLYGEAAAETAKPKPTVRPMEYRLDYSLPHTKLTDENVEQYINIELGKEYSRGKKLSIPYTMSPKEAYDQYDGSSPRIAVRLEIYVYLTEEDMIAEAEPYFTKSYIVLLHRTKGFVDSGVIEVLLKLDQDEIWYTYKVIGCNGRIGLDGWEPEPEPEVETEEEPAE